MMFYSVSCCRSLNTTLALELERMTVGCPSFKCLYFHVILCYIAFMPQCLLIIAGYCIVVQIFLRQTEDESHGSHKFYHSVNYNFRPSDI